MRSPRPRFQDDRPYCLHCMSRIARGHHLLDRLAKEAMRRMLHQIAEFCGIEVITYAVMGNHFHVLIRIRPGSRVSDAEIVRRCRLLYGSSDPRPSVWEEILARAGHEAERLRAQLGGRMQNASVFMKLFKQRFSIWFNRRRQGFGTLWAERFKATLVQDSSAVLSMVAGYIDLNPIRARLCGDPRDYRWCGYAEAASGHQSLRRGLASVYGTANWVETDRRHRRRILGDGPATEGTLSLAQALRHRLRYLVDGLVLGDREFIADYLRKHDPRQPRRKHPQRPRLLPTVDGPSPLPALAIARALRQEQRHHS